MSQMAEKCKKPGCISRSKNTKKCAVCGNYFHSACGEFSSYKTKTEAKVHLCSTCNAIPANSASLILVYSSRSNSVSSHSSVKRKKKNDDLDSESEGDEEDEEADVDLKTVLRAIKTGNAKSDRLVKGLRTEVSTFNSNLTLRCDGIDTKIEALEKEIQELKTCHAAEVSTLHDKFDELDFRTKTEVYIHGYANAGAADLAIIPAIIHLAEHLDVVVTERDIQSTRVVKRRNNPNASYAAATQRQARPPILAVDFYTHELALRLVEAKRAYGKLTNQDLLENSDTNPISVSFPLNREKYALLRLAKSRASIHEIKYVWNSRGSIFMREADGARAIKIMNSAHLDQLLPPATDPTSTPAQPPAPPGIAAQPLARPSTPMETDAAQ